MSEQQNTQQPVARISLHRVDGVPRATLLQTLGGAAVLPIGEIDVYAAPVTAANDPVPRDVLMALGEAVRDAWLEYDDGKRFTINIAEIADRHASQVQPERESITPQQLADHLAAGGHAQLDKRTTQPEPVNQQLLALVKSFGHKAGCAKNAFGDTCTCGVDAAIAAAEKEQGHD